MISIDWHQHPNARERIMFMAAMAVFLLGFLKACWFPSRSAIAELHGQLEKVSQEKHVAAQLAPPSGTPPPAGVSPPPSARMGGAGRIQDVQSALERLSQPLLLKGVNLMSLKSSDLEREGTTVRKKVELQLSGNFYSVAEYLESLESLPAPLVIEDFAIALNDDKSGRVTALVKGSFYGMGQ